MVLGIIGQKLYYISDYILHHGCLLEVTEPDPTQETRPTRPDSIRFKIRNDSTLHDPISDPTRPDTT
jgi:hypothetical protein